MTLACQRPIIFQVGPFINPDIAHKYYSPFANALSAEINCPVEIRLTNNIEELLTKLYNQKADLYITPTMYRHTLMKKGYQTAITSNQTTVYLVAPDKYQNTSNLDWLKGNKIIIASKYTSMYMQMNDFLSKENLIGNTEIIYGENSQLNLLALFDEKVEAAIALEAIYTLLPQTIRDKFPVLKEFKGDSADIITNKEHIHLHPAIKKNAHLLGGLSWETSTPIKPDNFSYQFEQQYKEFTKSFNQKPQAHSQRM